MIDRGCDWYGTEWKPEKKTEAVNKLHENKKPCWCLIALKKPLFIPHSLAAEIISACASTILHNVVGTTLTLELANSVLLDSDRHKLVP